jgi:hypothetical protein
MRKHQIDPVRLAVYHTLSEHMLSRGHCADLCALFTMVQPYTKANGDMQTTAYVTCGPAHHGNTHEQVFIYSRQLHAGAHLQPRVTGLTREGQLLVQQLSPTDQEDATYDVQRQEHDARVADHPMLVATTRLPRTATQRTRRPCSAHDARHNCVGYRRYVMVTAGSDSEDVL